MTRYLFLSLFAALADQISKCMVLEHIVRPHQTGVLDPVSFIDWFTKAGAPLPYFEMKVTSFFNLVMVWNHGVSFGIMNRAGEYNALIFLGISGAITAFFLYLLHRNDNRFQRIAISCVIGGAVGNMIDRIRFGAVADFLDFHAFGYHWPAFNLADSLICMGVIALIVHSILYDSKGYSR